MRGMWHWLLCAAVALVAGCGGTDPGGGTKTLYVRVAVETDGSTDNTRMGVEVREGSVTGALVTDAVVKVRGDRGETTLAWDGNGWGPFNDGAYARSGFAWEDGWAIEVVRGEDRLHASLEAPGHTVITEPVAGTVFMRAEGKPLVLRWKDAQGRRADEVRIELADAKFERTLSGDPLQLEIPVSAFVPTGNEKLRVWRRNAVELRGGTPGSLFEATTRHRIEFVVE